MLTSIRKKVLRVRTILLILQQKEVRRPVSSTTLMCCTRTMSIRASTGTLVPSVQNQTIIDRKPSSMYTQAWDVSYATNKGQWRGTSHYTIDQSYISSNLTYNGDVSCPSDVPYLSVNGADFCASYINYQPPVSTVVVTSTPALSIVTSTSTSFTTTVAYATEVQTSVSSTTVTIPPANVKRAVPTPVSLSTWSPSRISKACSAVATWSVTTSTTTIAATPYSTFVTVGVQTQTSTSFTTTTTAVVSTATVQPVNVIQRPGFEGGTGSDYYQLLPGGRWQIINDPSQAHSGNNYL